MCTPWGDLPTVEAKNVKARDATYVDDEALVLVASNPRKLDVAINILLDVLVGVFSQI